MGIFDRQGITDYEKVVEPLLEKLNQYTTTGTVEDFRENSEELNQDSKGITAENLTANLIRVIKTLAESKSENSANDKMLATRIVTAWLEFALKDQENEQPDLKLGKSIDLLLANQEISATLLAAMETLILRDERSPLFSPALSQAIINLLLRNKNNPLVNRIIDQLSSFDSENKKKILAGYAASLGKEDQEKFNAIIKLPQVQQNLTEFYVQLFLTHKDPISTNSIETPSDLKEQLFKEYDLEYELRLLTEGEEPGVVDKTTVYFFKQEKAWKWGISYPNNEHRRGFFDPVENEAIKAILDTPEDPSEKIAKLKAMIKPNLTTPLKEVLGDPLQVTACDQIFKSVLSLPDSKWAQWMLFTDAFKIVRNQIKSAKDLVAFFRRLPGEHVIDICKAMLKKTLPMKNLF